MHRPAADDACAVKVGGKDLTIAQKKTMEKTLAGFVVAKL
jgi:hypothetical protein